MFLALEGIDCSGKTTITQLLAAQEGMIPYATPPTAYRNQRERIDAEASPEEHYRFYLDGMRVASSEISIMLAKGGSVVCDRYWFTTYVYHRVMGLDVDAADFANMIMPDLTVLLLVSKEVQAERFLKRGLSAGDRRMINVQSLLEREYIDALSRLNIKSCAINTDHLTPQQVVQKVLSELP
jgi:thymidylate kinase